MAKGSHDVKVEFLVFAEDYKYRVFINGHHVREIEPSEDLIEASHKLVAYLESPAGL